jgi:hypothetical protein
MPLRAHLLARWAVDGVQLLVGSNSRPWVAAGRALLQRHIPTVAGGGFWGLALCDRQRLFIDLGGRVLPQPLRSLAVGLRALPPLRYVGAAPPAPGLWCYHVPLWCNLHRAGGGSAAAVGLVWTATAGDGGAGICPAWFVQSPSAAVCRTSCLVFEGSGGSVCCFWGSWGAVRRLQTFWSQCCRTGLEPVLQNRPRYRNMQAALPDLTDLVAAIPSDWQEAAWTVLQANRPRKLAVTPALIAAARAHACSDLGWRTRDGGVVRLADLTVAVATKLQSLDSHRAIAERHRVFEQQVQQFDMLQPGGGGTVAPYP